MSNNLNHANGVIINLHHEDTNGIDFTENDKVFPNGIESFKNKRLTAFVRYYLGKS
jgi:hypothetical protein